MRLSGFRMRNMDGVRRDLVFHFQWEKFGSF